MGCLLALSCQPNRGCGQQPVLSPQTRYVIFQYCTYSSNVTLDIARITALGVPVHSFSILWPPIMPFGQDLVNEQALAHYQDVIDTCIEYGVEPIVTLNY